jgi:hypothetical protein
MTYKGQWFLLLICCIFNQGPCLYMILLLQVIHLWLVSQLTASIPLRPIRPRLHFGYRCVLGSTFGHHAVLPLLALFVVGRMGGY